MNETRFQSCDDLYKAHRKLYEAHGGLLVERRANSEATDCIRSFVQRAAATGEVLETDNDRNLAWSLLNYWSNILFSLTREETRYSLAPSLAQPEKV